MLGGWGKNASLTNRMGKAVTGGGGEKWGRDYAWYSVRKVGRKKTVSTKLKRCLRHKFTDFQNGGWQGGEESGRNREKCGSWHRCRGLTPGNR